MYLERVKAKGRYYIYLKAYDSTITYGQKKVTLYNFGREEHAIKDIREWLKDKNKLPRKLKNVGCVRRDLESWLNSLEARASAPIRIPS